jgi:hypothetical protein
VERLEAVLPKTVLLPLLA